MGRQTWTVKGRLEIDRTGGDGAGGAQVEITGLKYVAEAFAEAARGRAETDGDGNYSAVLEFTRATDGGPPHDLRIEVFVGIGDDVIEAYKSLSVEKAGAGEVSVSTCYVSRSGNDPRHFSFGPVSGRAREIITRSVYGQEEVVERGLAFAKVKVAMTVTAWNGRRAVLAQQEVETDADGLYGPLTFTGSEWWRREVLIGRDVTAKHPLSTGGTCPPNQTFADGEAVPVKDLVYRRRGLDLVRLPPTVNFTVDNRNPSRTSVLLGSGYWEFKLTDTTEYVDEAADPPSWLWEFFWNEGPGRRGTVTSTSRNPVLRFGTPNALIGVTLKVTQQGGTGEKTKQQYLSTYLPNDPNAPPVGVS